MKVLKISSCAQCHFCTRYEAENDRQKKIAICEKSMRLLPKRDIFGLEVIADDEIPEWCELENDTTTPPPTSVHKKTGRSKKNFEDPDYLPF